MSKSQFPNNTQIPIIKLHGRSAVSSRPPEFTLQGFICSLGIGNTPGLNPSIRTFVIL